ncbi:MAG: hypothetical protein M3247_09075 [Thermoproteota archaeon]|nr:hypothetical protein [Thermoproteota archaeon]
MITNHNSNGNSLYGIDIHMYSKHMHEGMVNISYDAIRKRATKLNHKRMVWDDVQRRIV